LFTSFFLWGFDPTTLLGRFLTPFGPINAISPEVFQSFNPLFIVALTPLVMGFFAFLNNKGKDPSTPKKIGIGMIIAALGFVLVLIASLDLVSPYLLGGAAAPEASRVSPYWLMSSYLILTIAELFLSPMGLSFVSKVAPSRFQGLMQGGWLLATAVGNKFLFVGSLMWGRIDLYLLWGIFIICCALSAIFIFSIMKKLENATK
jgi:POT family proton-dependent oligopeptide transporter